MSNSEPNPDEIERAARQLGFGRAFDLFPDDIHEAARRASAQRATLEAPADPSCEPWPPMSCAVKP